MSNSQSKIEKEKETLQPESDDKMLDVFSTSSGMKKWNPSKNDKQKLAWVKK